MKPLLSICIPTYNRAVYLEKSIKSIISQDEFINGKVEIVISDNASTDNTEEVVNKYTAMYKNIYYSRNEINVRDNNFPMVLGKANGILRRLCNDTLCFYEGSLGYMCGIVESCIEEKPYIAWTNGCAKTKDDFKQVKFREFIRNISFNITTIACFSIWDDECNNIANDTYGVEYNLWQVRKSLELSSEKERIIIANKRLTIVQQIDNKNISYGLYKVFYINYFSLIAPYIEDGYLTENDKEYLEKDLLFRFFLLWCVRWENGNRGLVYSNDEDLNKCIYRTYFRKKYWKKYSICYWVLLKLNRLYTRIKGT